MNINHNEYQRKVRSQSSESLHYVISDCREALDANPMGHKAGYYADEIHYCAMELRRREQRAA